MKHLETNDVMLTSYHITVTSQCLLRNRFCAADNKQTGCFNTSVTGFRGLLMKNKLRVSEVFV